MVLKSAKRGVYSGNTLRASNSHYNRTYRRHSTIVKRHIPLSNTSSLRGTQDQDDFNALPEDVVLSLNKKERWTLPDEIRQSIQTEDPFAKVEKTDLFIHHKLNRESNCVAYYADKGRQTQLIPRGGRFFDSRCITESKPRDNVNPKRRRNSGRNIYNTEDSGEEVEEEYNTVRYEVYLPCSRFSSLTHNLKYIRPEEDPDEEGATFTGRRKKKQRGGPTQRDIGDLLDIDDPMELCEYELSDDEVLCDYSSAVEYTLADFVKTETKSRTRHKRKSRNAEQQSERKKLVIYVDEDIREESMAPDDETVKLADEDGTINVEAYKQRDPTSVIPVTVKLSKSELSRDILQSKYGALYLEADCKPRCFSLDMTDLIRDHVRSNKCFPDMVTSSLDLSCYLTFKDKCQGSEVSVFDVGLNLACRASYVRLENIDETRVYSLVELEELVLHYINTLPKEMVVQTGACINQVEILRCLELVDGTKSQGAECFHPGVINKLANTTRLPKLTDWELIEDVCNICFSEIKTVPDVKDDRLDSTCLNSCGHAFCNRCWREHLLSKLRSGASKFICPEYECNSTVDFATLLSLLHIGDIQKMSQRRDAERVNTSEEIIWCPIVKCGRAIDVSRIRNTVQASVICSCGTVLCCKCSKDAHWPATCHQAKRFRQKIIQSKDFIDLPKFVFAVDNLPDAVLVTGKPCPGCKRFIEKISGCPNMICTCGTTFCWECLRKIVSYAYHTCNMQNEREMVVTGLDMDFDALPRSERTRFYLKALQHLKQRTPVNIYQYRSRAVDLSVAIASFRTRHGDAHTLIPGAGLNTGFSQKRVLEFIVSMLSVYIELHHIIENVYVLLDEVPNGRLRKKVHCTIERMNHHANNIRAILEAGKYQNITFVIPQLVILRSCAKNCVKRLVQLIPAVMQLREKYYLENDD